MGRSVVSLPIQFTTTGQESWRYDVGSTTAANAEMAQQLCQHQQQDLIDLVAFCERAHKRPQRVSNINQMRPAAPALPPLLRVIALRRFI